MTRMMVEAAIMTCHGRIPQWILPENAEFIASMLGLDDAHIVPIEYMPELAAMDDQAVIVPIVSIEEITRTSDDGAATVAWATAWRLGAVEMRAALVANLAPDAAVQASSESAFIPFLPMHPEATGVAWMVKGTPGSGRCEFILVGDPQQAVESMNRMIEKEFSLAEGTRVCAAAMRAAARVVPEMPCPDSLMSRLETVASAVLSFIPGDDAVIVVDVSPSDGRMRVSFQGRPSAQSSPARQRR